MNILNTTVLAKGMFVALSLTALSAQANQTNYGNISAPFAVGYSNTFFAPTTQPFYDDYTFTLSPAASFNSITANINLGAFLGINNISARLYQGAGPFSPGATPLLQKWSTPFNAGPNMTGSITVIDMPNLAANTYTLEIRGDVVGIAGGSYSGNFNVAPIPEPESIAMLFAGIGLLGYSARRKNKNDKT